MSIPVSLAELPIQVERFGPAAYLLTVGADVAPRATAVSIAWENGRLVAGAGRHTAANARAHDAVALLWPAEPQTGHSLIVDGRAEVTETAAGPTVAIEPVTAILHLTSRAWGPLGEPQAANPS